MKILFVAAEGAPFAKTGGLGDVIGALPKSLVKNGHEVAVILPYYDVVSAKFGNQVEDLGFFYTNVGWRRQYVGIKKIVRDGVTFFFIDNEQYFNRGTVYGEWDDGERFGFFQMAALELMEKVDFIPDILHVHDYHTAMIPFLLKENTIGFKLTKVLRRSSLSIILSSKVNLTVVCFGKSSVLVTSVMQTVRSVGMTALTG